MDAFNVKQKLGFLIVFAIAMLVSVGGAGFSGAKRIEGVLIVMSEEKLPTATTLSTIRNSMATLHALCLEASLWREKKYSQKYFKNIFRRIEPFDTELTAAIAKFDKLSLVPEEAEAWKAFKSAYANWYTYASRTRKIIEQLGNNDDNGSNTEQAMQKQAELFDDYDISASPWGIVEPQLQKTLAALVDATIKAGNTAIDAGRTASKAATVAIMGIFGMATAILIVLGMVIARGIITPLENMRKAIVGVAKENDFTIRAKVTTRGARLQPAHRANTAIAARSAERCLTNIHGRP